MCFDTIEIYARPYIYCISSFAELFDKVIELASLIRVLLKRGCSSQTLGFISL